MYIYQVNYYNITGIVRDVWPCTQPDKCGKNGVNVVCDPAKCHPDFENYNGAEKNIVQATLGSDKRPLFNATRTRASVSIKQFL